MTKVARGYVRLSGTDSERSIASQKQDIRQYSENRDDLELDYIYDEGQGASGWDESREKYTEMKQDAANGEFEVLIVRQGSRIGRDKVERLDTFTDLANKHDVEFHTTKRGYVDPDNPTDLLMEVFEATKDDEKRSEIEQAKEEIQARQEEGYWQGQPPRGLKHDVSVGPPGLVPTAEFGDVLSIIAAKSQGLSHREALEDTDFADSRRDIVTTVMQDDRLEVYCQVAKQSDKYEWPTIAAQS